MLNGLSGSAMNRCRLCFEEISRMIDILFSNGIMLYTDPNRFIYDVNRLQSTMNESLKAGNVRTIHNRLFTLMRDRAIQYQGIHQKTIVGRYNAGRNSILDFLTWATNYGTPGEAALENMIRHMDKIGFKNAAMFLYRKPVIYAGDDPIRLPETMQLRYVIRNGELFTIPGGGKECPVAEIYSRDELPVEKLGYFSFPLFCGKYLFGMLVCGVDGRLFEIGEFLTFQLSRTICMNWIEPALPPVLPVG